MRPRESLSLRVVERPDEFRALARGWNELLAQSPADTIFLTWEWQFSWWEAFGGDLFIVLVSATDELVGILPFVRIRERSFERLVPIGAPESDYLDLIIKQGWEERVLGFFFRTVLAEQPRIGIVEIDSIPERPGRTNEFLRSFSEPGLFLQSSTKVCATIALPASWDEYLASLSTNMRGLLRRGERRLAKEFRVEIGVVTEEAELGERMEQLFALHQMRQRKIGHAGSFARAEARRFHDEVARRLLAQGRLRLYHLLLDGAPAASYYLFRYGRAVLYYASGFDPRFGRYSPGAVLMGRAVRDAIEEGLEEFDLLRGEKGYKFRWAGTKRINTTYLIHRTSPAVNRHLRRRRLRQRLAMPLAAVRSLLRRATS